MKNLQSKELLSCFDDTFEQLYSLESLIKVIQDSCRNKEIYSIYYHLPLKDKTSLSQERNNYINLLALALDKISNLKEISLSIEKQLTLLK